MFCALRLGVREIAPVFWLFSPFTGRHACAPCPLRRPEALPYLPPRGPRASVWVPLTTVRALTASAKGSKKEKKEEPSDERVRVVVRIRPPIRKDEMYGEGSEALQVDKERNLLFLLQKEGQGVNEKTKQFVFDRVLWKDSEQVTADAHHGP